MGFEERLEGHRVDLTGYCYRMLADLGEAEDAVQETMIRAWRKADSFDERKAALRTWLYRIASNVCIDMLRSSQRRGLAMDLTSASTPGPDPGSAVNLSRFVLPVPDHRVLPDDGDPAELAVQRETIRLAFMAALQQLPPRQRAVLILRQVVGWSAAEVADLLNTSPTAVNSLLQRARTTMALPRPHDADLSPHDESLLSRYVEAFTTHDIAALVTLLHEDATMSMPPYLWWLQGRAAIHEALLGGATVCANGQLVRTSANGSPAFGLYRDGEALGVAVIDLRGTGIERITTFLEPSLMHTFGLPMTLDQTVRM
ncbi:sigma-70 family RNA polymerase sigma factor [Nocardioides sp. T5]|uniref:sigma-70 family RNA polymerase sigma factor n=1 Tax=Nocardioides sp. T5 TaxID=3400182 RepID=UPI003A879CD5